MVLAKTGQWKFVNNVYDQLVHIAIENTPQLATK